MLLWNSSFLFFDFLNFKRKMFFIVHSLNRSREILAWWKKNKNRLCYFDMFCHCFRYLLLFTKVRFFQHLTLFLLLFELFDKRYFYNIFQIELNNLIHEVKVVIPCQILSSLRYNKKLVKFKTKLLKNIYEVMKRVKKIRKLKSSKTCRLFSILVDCFKV